MTPQPDYASMSVIQKNHALYPPGSPHRVKPEDLARAQLMKLSEQDQRRTRAIHQHDLEYRDDRCRDFQDDGEHYDKDCGAPHCPWFTPAVKMPVETIADHSLGSRDELLSHIQRCADRGWEYDDLYAEAHRVELATRPYEPWTDKDLVPMIEGALRKAPAHMAENQARADADYAMLAALGVTVAGPQTGQDVLSAGQVIYPPTRTHPGKKRIQWPL